MINLDTVIIMERCFNEAKMDLLYSTPVLVRILLLNSNTTNSLFMNMNNSYKTLIEGNYE